MGGCDHLHLRGAGKSLVFKREFTRKMRIDVPEKGMTLLCTGFVGERSLLLGWFLLKIS